MGQEDKPMSLPMVAVDVNSLNQIMSYLATKPWAEVHQIMAYLSSLKPE